MQNKKIKLKITILIIIAMVLFAAGFSFFMLQNPLNFMAKSQQNTQLQTSINTNHTTSESFSASEIIENSLLLNLNTIDLSGLELTNVNDLKQIDLSNIKTINLANNNLGNDCMGDITSILQQFANINTVCVYDNKINLSQLENLVLHNTKIIYGVQNFNFAKFEFNKNLPLEFYWNQNYNQNFGLIINDVFQTETSNQTSIYLSDFKNHSFYLEGKSEFLGYNSLLSTTLISVKEKAPLIFERNDNASVEIPKNLLTFSDNSIEYEVQLVKSINLNVVAKSLPVQFAIAVENTTCSVMFETTYEVADTRAPVIDFGEEHNVVYIKQNSIFGLSPIFFDNGEVVENYEVNHNFEQTSQSQPGFALTYEIYSVPESAKNLVVEQGMDFSELIKISNNEVSTAEFGTKYVLIYQAKDATGNTFVPKVLQIIIVGDTIDSTLVEPSLFSAIKNLTYLQTGINRENLFSTDLRMLCTESINLFEKEITSVRGIELFDFTGIASVNLACNKLNLNSMENLNALASTYANLKIIAFFNQINNASNYQPNIFLGVQNLRTFYLNASPDETYSLYNDFSSYFNFSIYYKSGLDGSTLFSENYEKIPTNELISFNQNSGPLSSEYFPQTGYYFLRFISLDGKFLFAYELIYGSISLYNATLTVEAGSDFTGEALKFSAGLSANNFVVEAVDEQGEQFCANKLGTFKLTYNVFEKQKGFGVAKKGEKIVSLTQNVEVVDTTGPSISPAKPEAYSYLGREYVDSGATATDILDGDCEVQTSGTVNVNLLGDYTLTYTATDSRGNTSTLNKIVHVIYPPVNKVELLYQENENFQVDEEIEFSIKFFSGEMQIPVHYLSYSIYVDDEFVKNCSTDSFTLTFAESGRSVICVKVFGASDNGENYYFAKKINFDFKDEIWWKGNLVFGLCFSVIILVVLCFWVYTNYAFPNKKIRKIKGLKNNEKRNKQKLSK